MAVRGGQTISKAIEVLRVVAQSETGSTFTDLQVASSQPKATLHRLIQSMIDERLIRFDPEDRRYRLGYGLLELAGLAWERVDVRHAARDAMMRLSRESGEAVDIVIPEGIEIIHVDKIEGPQKRRVEPRVGDRSPAYCTGAGKALLAYLDEAEKLRMLDIVVFHPLTPKTPTTRAQLIVQLQQVRRCGYAVESQEQELGIISVAAPIFDHRGRAVAGMSVTAPLIRTDERRIAALGRMALAAANQATRNCGGSTIGTVEEYVPVVATELEPSWLPEGDVPC